MFREKCVILKNTLIAPAHYALTLESSRIASIAAPGQFVQILCGEGTDPLLPRPFSFLTASKRDFTILYQVVGKGTGALSKIAPGKKLWVTGPLGHGFTASIRRRQDSIINTLVLIGGGVGIPPLYHLAETFLAKKTTAVRKENIHVFLGARSKELLLCRNDFKKLGVTLHLATEDGSMGKQGYVTEILDEFLQHSNPMRTRAYTCGPTPMLKAVSALATRYQTPCEVSVEVPMACGFGACLGCAIKVKHTGDSEHRFAIACQEGPVFKAGDILW
jgi:dihydroorotate dehydrogenase electron transfer subunit